MTNLLVGCVAALSLLVHGHTARETLSREVYSRLLTVRPAEIVQPGGMGGVRLASPTHASAPERGPCNMPIVRGSAALDPKSIAPIERRKTDYKIRAIEPSVCWDARRAEEIIR